MVLLGTQLALPKYHQNIVHTGKTLGMIELLDKLEMDSYSILLYMVLPGGNEMCPDE